MARPVRLRAVAVADVDRAVEWYRTEAGVEVALRFVDAIEATVDRIGRSPRGGSLRLAFELDIPELRFRQVPGFPYLVFYVVADEVVDVWRILHTRRDVTLARRARG